MAQPINYREPGEQGNRPGGVIDAAKTPVLFSQPDSVQLFLFVCCLCGLTHGCAGVVGAP